jgi:hypothetical protein
MIEWGNIIDNAAQQKIGNFLVSGQVIYVQISVSL